MSTADPPRVDVEKHAGAFDKQTSASTENIPHPEELEPPEAAHRRDRTGSEASNDSNEDARQTPLTLKHTASRASSVKRDPVKVPRNQRRGLFARLSLIAEVENPYDLSNTSKWTITCIVALAGAAAPMGSTIIFPALIDIAEEFNSTPVVTNMSVAFYMLSMSIFPLWWSSFSETLGRRTIYIISFFLALVFAILSAVSVNIAMFVVMRILSGGAAASVQAVGAGTVADVWEVRERGRAMGYFYLGPLCGPLLGPILGGILAQTLGWRSVLWSQAIYGLLLFLSITFFLPETIKRRRNITEEAERDAIAETALDGGEKPVRPALTRTSTAQSAKIRAKKLHGILMRCFVDPLKILLHARKPPVAVAVFYAAMTFASLYFLNVSVQQTFAAPPYNYSTLVVGFLYAPASVGYFAASILGGSWLDRIMKREAAKAGRYDARGRPIFLPEDRMRENIWIASFMFPAALIWYGWTVQEGVNVAAPIIANFFFGVGSMLVFGCMTTMLTEFMPNQSSHGIALNNFVRNIFSCTAGLVAEPAISGIGNGWLFTILGVWTFLVGLFSIFAMRYYAKKWRSALAGEAS